MKKYEVWVTLSFKIEDDRSHSVKEKVVGMDFADTRIEILALARKKIKDGCDELIASIDSQVVTNVKK